jgi:Na+/H+ antiporter NhaD/arsenite permease-like protein
LFTAFFLLSAALTIVTSNDIVILCLTPIIAYVCQHTGADPIPLLMGQFVPANVLSLVLIIGNPTNIILAGSQNITFFGYLKWMMLPSLAAGVTAYIALRLMYRTQLAQPLRASVDAAGAVIKDRRGAWVGLSVLAVVLVLLALSPLIHISMAAITGAGAAVMLVRDIVHDVRASSSPPGGAAAQSAALAGPHLRLEDDEEAIPQGGPGKPAPDRGATGKKAPAAWDAAADGASCGAASGAAAQPVDWTAAAALSAAEPIGGGSSSGDRISAQGVAGSWGDMPADNNSGRLTSAPGQGSGAAEIANQRQAPSTPTLSVLCERLPGYSAVQRLAQRLPTVATILGRMPWKLLPFVVAMFTLTEALSIDGWVGLLARALASVVKGTGPVGASLFMLVISALACNVMNNQPMSILFARVLQHASFQGVDPRTFQAVVYALVAGSNLGANITLIGALAGIMWVTQTRAKGINITYWAFARVGALLMMPVILVTGLVIGAEA